MTQCNPTPLDFHPLGPREVIASFDGGTIYLGWRLACCCARPSASPASCGSWPPASPTTAIRTPSNTRGTHRPACLRLGPGLRGPQRSRLAAHRPAPGHPRGQDRPHRGGTAASRDRGKALAGKSTLNRLELTPPDATADSRYKKIVAHPRPSNGSSWTSSCKPTPSRRPRSSSDLDATDDPLHGHQEGRFFHGYYKEFCYLPLYIFCGEHLLLRQAAAADIDASAGAVEELERIIPQIRAAWPNVRILVRGDSGFCREEIMAWCEGHAVDYLFGLAKNSRLCEILEPALADAQAQLPAHRGGRPRLRGLRLPDAEQLEPVAARGRQGRAPGQGSQPAFRGDVAVCRAVREARPLYEEDYCARGDMENRIKEQQLMLFADRTSTATLRANQLRLWFYLGGVRADAGVAAAGFGGHGAWPSASAGRSGCGCSKSGPWCG